MNNANLTEKPFCTINSLALSLEQHNFLLAFYKVSDKKALRKFLSNGYNNISINYDLSISYPNGVDFEEIRPLLIAEKTKQVEAKKLADEKAKIAVKKWLKENAFKYPSFVVPLMARKAYFDYEVLPKKLLAQKGQMLQSGHNQKLFDRIKHSAYNNADFGRLKKTYEGSNSMYPSVRTETNGGSGWDCVKWHYADFTAIINPQKTKIWVKYANGSEENITIWKHFAKINGKTRKFDVEKTTKITQQAKLHILSHFNRGNVLNIVKDSADWCYQDKETKELYHFDSEISNWRTRNPFTIAVTAFKKRRIIAREQAKQKELENRCFSNLDKFFVSYEDSIQAGNCVPHTDSTRINVMNQLGINTDLFIAVRADVLMNTRNDFYSKRAVWFSFTSHYKEKSLAW